MYKCQYNTYRYPSGYPAKIACHFEAKLPLHTPSDERPPRPCGKVLKKGAKGGDKTIIFWSPLLLKFNQKCNRRIIQKTMANNT